MPRTALLVPTCKLPNLSRSSSTASRHGSVPPPALLWKKFNMFPGMESNAFPIPIIPLSPVPPILSRFPNSAFVKFRPDCKPALNSSAINTFLASAASSAVLLLSFSAPASVFTSSSLKDFVFS